MQETANYCARSPGCEWWCAVALAQLPLAAGARLCDCGLPAAQTAQPGTAPAPCAAAAAPPAAMAAAPGCWDHLCARKHETSVPRYFQKRLQKQGYDLASLPSMHVQQKVIQQETYVRGTGSCQVNMNVDMPDDTQKHIPAPGTITSPTGIY